MHPLLKLFTWKELKKLIPEFKKPIVRPGLCCINFFDQGIAISYVLENQQQIPILKSCDFLSCTPPTYTKVLTEYVKRKNLIGVSCVLLLQSIDYQVVMIEPLDVPAEEMAAALRWRIKDIIDFPLEEAVIDYFPAPMVMPGHNNMLNVVVSNTKRLEEYMECVRDAGLNMQCIDIPELALRNLVQRMPDKLQGVGIIWVKAEDSLFIFVQDETVYLTRNLHGLSQNILHSHAYSASEELDAIVEEFSLEVQRSLDYYQIQLRQPPIASLYMSQASDAIINFLTPRVIVDQIKLITLYECIGIETDLTPEILGYSLATIGGALRKEQRNVPAN